MLIMSLTFYTILLISGLFLPNTMLKFWIVTISYMFTNLGQYSYYLIMMISIINTVEYNEYKNGNRDEAIIASLRPFLTKFSSAIVVMLTSLSYLMFGITNITNQISSFEQQTNLGFISEAEKLSSIKSVLSGVNRFQSAGLLFVMCLLPAVLMALSYFLYKKHYILDEVEYERIVKELERGKV